jgi:hypothetical protein
MGISQYHSRPISPSLKGCTAIWVLPNHFVELWHAMGQNASGALVFTSAPLYFLVLHSYVIVLHHITPLSYMRNDRL